MAGELGNTIQSLDLERMSGEQSKQAFKEEEEEEENKMFAKRDIFRQNHMRDALSFWKNASVWPACYFICIFFYIKHKV